MPLSASNECVYLYKYTDMPSDIIGIVDSYTPADQLSCACTVSDCVWVGPQRCVVGNELWFTRNNGTYRTARYPKYKELAAVYDGPQLFWSRSGYADSGIVAYVYDARRIVMSMAY